MFNKRYYVSCVSLIMIAIFLSNVIASTNFNLKSTNFMLIDDIYDKNTIFKSEKYRIIYPISTIPALVEKNGHLTIRFVAEDFDEVFAYVSTAYEPVVNEIWLDIENIWYEESIWYIKVHIPSFIPEELYNLSLIFINNEDFYECSQPRAINVFKEFSDNFSFIHITDFHYGDPRGFVENVRETIGYKSIKRCIKEVNLLHPDFVIISGDLVFGQLYPFEYRREYEKCYNLIQSFDVPTFLAPGNHDGYRRFREDGLEYWKEFFGQLYYSFDFGDYHFVSVNSYDMPSIFRWSFLLLALNWGGSISDEQLSWINKDLKESNSDLTFIFLHHNPLWETMKDSLMLKKYKNREELLSLIYNYDVDMVLAGHVHRDTVNVENDVIFLTTTTPQSEIRTDDGYWGYRLVEIKNGKIFSYNYKEPKYSIPSYKIDCKIWESKNLVLTFLENDLEKDVNIFLKFTMPIGTYMVRNCEIIMRRSNDEFIEIYAVADISKLSNKKIILFRISD